MNEWLERALNRLKEEKDEGKKLNKYAGVMAEPVKKQLEDFCRQDEEFAQAVVQGGSFKDCMAAVTKSLVGNGLSDLEAYQRAVRFYFPGARVKMQMSVDLVGDAAQEEQVPKKGMVLDLADFL